MLKPFAFALAALIALGAAAQDDPKAEAEKRKQEEKAKEEEAKKVVAEFKKEFGKAKNPGEQVSALDILRDAEPHRLIRETLAGLIGYNNPDVRAEVIGVLGSAKWKYDKDVATLLFNTANQTPIRDLDFKTKCIFRFGKVAPFSMAPKLKNMLGDDTIEIVKESVDACKEINSVRMLPDLIALLGKLDSIREDKKDPSGGSYGPPPPGVPGGAPNQQDEKAKMKKEVTPMVISAINSLLKNYDDKAKVNTYVEATKYYSKNRSFIDKQILPKEDRIEKGLPPEDEEGKK